MRQNIKQVNWTTALSPVVKQFSSLQMVNLITAFHTHKIHIYVELVLLASQSKTMILQVILKLPPYITFTVAMWNALIIYSTTPQIYLCQDIQVLAFQCPVQKCNTLYNKKIQVSEIHISERYALVFLVLSMLHILFVIENAENI